MIDEAAALAVILRELPDATPDTDLSGSERLDAIVACREAFSLQLTVPEIDLAITPAEIARVAVLAARDQFMV